MSRVAYLFYKDGQLLCAILPKELPIYPVFDPVNDFETGFAEGYEKSKERARAEAIANALPVSNPDIIDIQDYCVMTVPYKDGKLYQWLGTVEKELFDDGDDRFIIEMYRLIPPKYNLEDKLFIEENKE